MLKALVWMDCALVLRVCVLNCSVLVFDKEYDAPLKQSL